MVGADTAWILAASALVLFMTLPGLALFYGGLVRARNVLSVFLHCYAIACLMSILWFSFGYSIAFGSGTTGWFGGFDKVFMNGVTLDSTVGTLPETVFFVFQMTFAIITPALIVGAYVERVGFGFVMIFSGLWMLLCYAPVAHWLWGSGILAGNEETGLAPLFGAATLDYAGGLVVHLTAGVAALVVAVFLGARKDDSHPPHSPGFVMLGAAMLWVGWYGFNGGSALAANGTAGNAIAVTHISAAAASLSWAAWERIKFGQVSLVGMVTGTIAGLASATGAAGFIGPVGGLIIGLIAGVLCQEAVTVVRKYLKIDDTLDVFAVHGVGGIFGTLMVAFLGAGSFGAQLGGLLLVGVFTVAVTLAVLFVARAITTMRVDEETEKTGLDIAVHGESAYEYGS